MGADGERYSRNIAFFGADGQSKIQGTKVAIVGLGGLGSHVAQQLAYLGVRSFGLIDHDVVTASSMNRLIGAVPSDVDAANQKVAVAERMIGAIQPNANVRTAPETVQTTAAAKLIAGSDLLFGCLDRDLPRLALTALAARYARPYFDLASDTDGSGPGAIFGGRIVFADGNQCLSCLDLLDQDEMRRDGMTREQREADDRIYGVRRGDLNEAGPSVVSVNGVVASLGVTEFMAFVTGVRSPAINLTYRGDLQRITRVVDPPRPGCWYCKALWGKGRARIS